MSGSSYEALALWAGLGAYSVIAVLAIVSLVLGKRLDRPIGWLLAAGIGLHTFAIGARWERIGHLPVGNAFEMLSANLWGLMVAVGAGFLIIPRLRAFMAPLMPVVIMVMAWMLLKPTDESLLPPTYKTIWLYIHIAFIKLFLGCAFIALGLGALVLLRKRFGQSAWAGRVPGDAELDQRGYRFMALALIFDTCGIVAGAIWAQNAWGRYWSWDPLETWSLITWLTIGLSLHVRASFKTTPATNALLVVAVFVVAFFTFFGVPFVSTSLHKGQI
jgi:cytochrome c-type biogenesis protein CcsB